MEDAAEEEDEDEDEAEDVVDEAPLDTDVETCCTPGAICNGCIFWLLVARMPLLAVVLLLVIVEDADDDVPDVDDDDDDGMGGGTLVGSGGACVSRPIFDCGSTNMAKSYVIRTLLIFSSTILLV